MADPTANAMQAIAKAMTTMQQTLQQSAQQQQTTLQAMTAALQAALPQLPGGGAGGAGGVQVQFHSTPLSSIAAGNLIDYSTKEGKRHYKEATASLFPDGDNFNVKPAWFQTMISYLTQRIKDLQFDQPGSVCMLPDGTNIVRDYGTTMLELIYQHEATYIANQDRHAQDNTILKQMLLNSLTSKGMDRVNLWHSQWTHTVNNIQYEGGASLLKVIIRESYLDTTATVSSI